MIAVAIGNYIGEGFNFPRFGTLLLAMPISWSANVEQYAGRINRDFAGRKNVMIFDYIDARIPVLERMNRKRLSVYRRIGYEIRTDIQDAPVVSRSLSDGKTYAPVCLQDLLAAQKEIVFGSRKVPAFLSTITERQMNGVKIVVLTCPSSNSAEDELRQHLVDKGWGKIWGNGKIGILLLQLFPITGISNFSLIIVRTSSTASALGLMVKTR